MTRGDIIRMAREAGFDVYDDDGTIYATSECTGALGRFAKLAAAAERQACALTLLGTPGLEDAEYPVLACAQAIRARNDMLAPDARPNQHDDPASPSVGAADQQTEHLLPSPLPVSGEPGKVRGVKEDGQIGWLTP